MASGLFFSCIELKRADKKKGKKGACARGNHPRSNKPPCAQTPLYPRLSYQLNKEGEHFGLTLDTQGFSPEELSVRQVGKKMRVSGKSEKKQEDEKGSYSYRLQEFRQEFDLPEEVNHEAVSCYLSPDGKLHIQAAKVSSVEQAERELTIKRSSEEETQAPSSGD
uniref:SHSP domain-containing protein n=1 Tax=Kryptolebias marmoratus TaxID=37003 RepID=A0A3Q3B973_KRYMA